MRDSDNSVEIGGNNAGSIVQAGKYHAGASPWTVVAVAVTAILGLTALALVLGFSLRDSAEAGQPVGTPGTDAAPATTTTQATMTPAPPSTPTAPSTTQTTATPRETAFRKLHSERSSVRRTNVDVDPPQPAPGGTGAAYTLDWLPAVGGGLPATADLYAGGFPPTARNYVAEWPDGGDPTGEQCADRIRRFGTNVVPLAPDGTYCVLSPAGRVVVLSEIEFTERDVTALLTVWSR